MELTKATIKQYLDSSSSPCVSIFVPTQPSSNSQTINEDRIRYKNALHAIDENIQNEEALSQSYKELVSLTENKDFWLHQKLSIAVLADKDGYSTVKLPFELTSASHFGDNYAVSPLAIMENLDKAYYLLDINFKQPILYTGSALELRAVEDANLPAAIEDELDITTERHSSVSSRSGVGGSDAVFYGHNEVDESRSHEATRYLRILSDRISTYLAGSSLPLIITGSPKVVAEYKSMANYQHIVDEEVSANYDNAREQSLLQKASEVINNLSSKEREKIVNRYNETDFEHKVDGITAIKTATEQGRVECVLLPILRYTTDSVRDIDHQQLLVELPEDFAAFEEAIREVLLQGGEVIPVEKDSFPDDPSMKALLRF